MENAENGFIHPEITVTMQQPRKLILRCLLSPGDLVMLSAALRDLHRCYPGQFVTDVRTACPELWVNNPLLTPLDEKSPEVETIDCEYPLIHRCDLIPRHSVEGFLEFLNERLGLAIRLSAFKGHIPLSRQEQSWFSQVHELTQEDTPFWILNAGGKYDVTVKWWSPERFQRVVDHFRGRILFVQVGQRGHHHPKLRDVVDLRGRTSLRQLIRLVYHSQGVLSPVTAVMHLAAAVESKPGSPPLRPCVVVAGGREPVHWEAYPGHQFVHTIGALPCCARGGCWRDRVDPLGDGDPRDDASRLCLDVANGQPKCLDLISAEEIIRRIDTYYAGGALAYLSRSQWKAARRAIRRSSRNGFEQLPLTRGNVRIRFEQALRSLPAPLEEMSGRGIIIPAGGCRFFTTAWVCIRQLRELGCHLPIQVWHLGPEEMTPDMARLLEGQGVSCVDARAVRQRKPSRILGGWELKTYALAHCVFAEVLLLDADNVPVTNPEFLFETPAYRETGALFWPDLGRLEKTQEAWDLLGIVRPDGPEFESGQIVLDKRRCWHSLALGHWLNEQSDFFYQFLHGDKETLHLAFERRRQPYTLVPTPPLVLPGTMVQHDLDGRRLFQHRNTSKWTLFANQQPVEGFWRERECRAALSELRQHWDSRSLVPPRWPFGAARKGISYRRPPRVQAGMLSCDARREMREGTLQRLAQTDWGDAPVLLQLDDPSVSADPRERQQRASLALLRQFLGGNAPYLLFLEDDLDFNRFIRHNLEQWPLFLRREIQLAGLYNPGLLETACDLVNRAYLIAPDRIYGSQALLISRAAARYCVDHWDEVEGMQDIRISRLAGRFRPPVFYHSPSLVQHVGASSTWGGAFHEASDFDPLWRADELAAQPMRAGFASGSRVRPTGPIVSCVSLKHSR